MTATATPLLLALGLAVAGCIGDADPGITEVSRAQVAAWIDQKEAPLLLDVRTPDEYANGHVPGSVNIPYDELALRLSELGARPEQPVVVYCESGRRAAKAAETLMAAGFTSIEYLAGHMSAWRNAGLPTE